ECLAAKLDRLVVFGGEHRETRRGAQDLRLGGRHLASGYQLSGAPEMHKELVAMAAYPADLAEQRLRPRGALSLAVLQEVADCILEQRRDVFVGHIPGP